MKPQVETDVMEQPSMQCNATAAYDWPTTYNRAVDCNTDVTKNGNYWAPLECYSDVFGIQIECDPSEGVTLFS